MKEDNKKNLDNVNVAYPLNIKVSGGTVKLSTDSYQVLINSKLKHINMKQVNISHKL